MAFRKRNVALARTSAASSPSNDVTLENATAAPGVRPSPLTSHPTTSTGTPSLDGLLAGHAGLALGSSLLVEESGTTDFAGALLKYYAAEGICQRHVLHVVGVGEGWVRELPGIAEEKGRDKAAKVSTVDDEKMKIAWRYERLGQAGERALPDRSIPSTFSGTPQVETPFCHTFDLAKRITLPADAKVNHIPISPSQTYERIMQSLSQSLVSSPSDSIHRLVIPSILSPALYPPTCSRPEAFLAFCRSLRALLRQYSTRLTAIITLPLELYPRTSGLVRWAEILSDGVVELTPFPHLMDASNALAESGGARASEEQPQGMVKFHRLPITTERGEGGASVGNSLGEDLAFTVSRRKFVIKPFSLPPIDGDQEAQRESGRPTGKDVEF
ncbi:related to RNA polymerase II elongator complex, subunit ELP4 [Lecanosticta acicola]|uniref:Elongator complex protein 4 n=1 Tax=Lecanosticta acicola TaxID=111012 RepID=A0AAI8Z7D2_9PEZI|nr:related to RNA polymerase II elongator complex, subunit ELP4 [Lecanosticta acicola]